MISRKSTMAVANAYVEKFSHQSTSSYGISSDKVHGEDLYDFLYEHEYQAWFCNASKTNYGRRTLREWFLKIHTGETLYDATPNWPWDKRQKLGQEYLKNLSKDILNHFTKLFDKRWYADRYRRHYDEIIRRLEIDGYIFRKEQLYQEESDVLDVEQEIGLLETLHKSLGLSSQDSAFEFFKLSEEHYVSGKWSDSIANSRKFFESIMQQVAIRYSSFKSISLSHSSLDRPVAIRSFLEQEGLFERKEREAVDKIYGLLSHTGSHPYMAEKDQARLLRQISLTITQFILLRLEGALKKD